MRNFAKTPEGRELTVEDLYSFGFRAGNLDFDNIIAILKRFHERGEQVYYIFDDRYIMKSDEVDKYEDPNYISNNCYKNTIVHPITSIDEFKKEIDALGDWRDPNNQEAYCKIMLQLCEMYYGYDLYIDLEEEISGRFKGYYPNKYINMLVDILKDKFPYSNEIFDVNGNLYPTFDNEDKDFYVYLGNFNAGNGINILAGLGRFVSAAYESGLAYSDSGINLDIIRNMVEQTKRER